MRKNFFPPQLLLVLPVLTITFFTPGDIKPERLYYSSPALLPGTTRPMKTAGYWISRHTAPDQTIMPAADIQKLNEHIQNDLKLSRDIFSLPAEYSGENLRATLNDTLKSFQQEHYFKADGWPVSGAFYQEVLANMNVEAVGDAVALRYGLIVHFADERIFPMGQGLYEERGDFAFDELQNSDLDIGTLVAVLHQSRDGQWLYVRSALSAGWVRRENVAIGPLSEVQGFAQARIHDAQTFVVVRRAKADIFLNPEMTEYYDYARMGSVFPLRNAYDNDALEIILPTRQEDGSLMLQAGHVKRWDVNEGFLIYTPRHVLEQAFELLNEPYGWGGMHGEQDCSRFLIEIFSTFGINLPRNSQDQAQVGEILTQFDAKTPEVQRLEALKKTDGQIAVLTLKGHIMLYLGLVDGRPYAIHAAWAYREKGLFGDRARVINRVAVTELSLGKGTSKRSWLERLLGINIIKLKEEKKEGAF